ncbi:MAG: alpha/beta hydrolase, partial [Phycisphaerae bacterium]
LLWKYIRIALNIFEDTHPPMNMGVVDFEPIHGEVVRFRSFDGTSLRGMHLRTGRPEDYRGTVIFCHEFNSDMYSCARYATPLIEAGFDVFTFDFRGHGDSSCPGSYRPLQWPSDKDMEDVLGACAYVESCLAAEGKPIEVGMFGVSRGAGSAILAAAIDPHVKAVICDGAFSTDTTLISFMKRWAYIFASIRLVYENHTEGFWRFLLWVLMRAAQPKMGCRYPSVRKALADMQPRPMMFVHGQRDSYIRVEQSRLLYDLAPDPKQLWIVEGAKHNQSVIVEKHQYARRTVGFFEEHLATESAAEKTAAHSGEVA